MAHPIAERMLRQRWLMRGGSPRRPEGAARPEARGPESRGRRSRRSMGDRPVPGLGGRRAEIGVQTGRASAGAAATSASSFASARSERAERTTGADPGMAIARGRGRGSNGDAQAWRRRVLNGAWQSLEVAGGRGAGGGVTRRSPARRLGLGASEVGARHRMRARAGCNDAER